MYIAIEGAIGVGKTTLARLLQPSLQAELLLEVFEENPFLADFYRDRERYAFQTQIFFLLSRYHQHRAIPQLLKSNDFLVTDYTFKKDALFANINLEGDELDTYHQVHNALAEKIPLPDLIIYLRASTDVLMQRIAYRDRPYERDMDRAYIDAVNREYEAYFGDGYQRSRLLTLDTEELNYVTDKEALREVENQVRRYLELPPFQKELPFPLKEDR